MRRLSREVAEDGVLPDEPGGAAAGVRTGGIAVDHRSLLLRPRGRARPPLLLAVRPRLLLAAAWRRRRRGVPRRPPLGAAPRHVLLGDVHVHGSRVRDRALVFYYCAPRRVAARTAPAAVIGLAGRVAGAS
ncbi:hypothetical protein GQ55_9G192200 [Panicum hallii var. hallii]|uniref:Uncharacterized protein n=1 Tax=Panicum hallii var. hallii TaxID=1504633 RepID=A0A2T7C4Z2_9POAL|nr:hypothetical protein GQ55_9G192200 [Panicum hallii var. hallii]